MPLNALFAVFEDFNDHHAQPAPPVPKDEPPPVDEIGEARAAGWTEGYLIGRLGQGAAAADQPLDAQLLTLVHDLTFTASEAADAAAVLVADLLVNTLIVATSDTWSAQLQQRVRQLTDRLKPALTVSPEFFLRDAQGTIRHFGDISDLSRALDGETTAEDVTIRWQRGEATISRMAFLGDLRDAIIPLSASLGNEQLTAGNQT